MEQLEQLQTAVQDAKDEVTKEFTEKITDRENEIAKEQMFGGYGGMLSFSVKGGLDSIKKFLPKLKYAHMAANLGSVESIVGIPATTSHVECSANERAAAGIPEGLVRYSTGIEDVSDLITDLDQALDYIS